MSDKTQSFFAGSLVTTILTLIVVSTMSWVGYNASQVPVLETEMRNMNKNLIELTDTAKETNTQLKAYTKYHGQNLAIISKAITTHDAQIGYIEDMIAEYKHFHIGAK